MVGGAGWANGSASSCTSALIKADGSGSWIILTSHLPSKKSFADSHQLRFRNMFQTQCLPPSTPRIGSPIHTVTPDRWHRHILLVGPARPSRSLFLNDQSFRLISLPPQSRGCIHPLLLHGHTHSHFFFTINTYKSDDLPARMIECGVRRD